MPAMRMRLRLALLLPAMAGGCALLPSFETDEPGGRVAGIWRENMVTTIQGRLQGPPSSPGRCRLLYPPVGDPFALIGSTGDFGPGAEVRITGPIATWSACETYRTIRVDQITPVR